MAVVESSPLRDMEREYPHIYDFTRLCHAWTVRSFSQEDLYMEGRRLFQMWRMLARTVGGNPVLTEMDKQREYDPMYCPMPIVQRMVYGVSSGATDAFIATSVRSIMPELISGYFPRLKQSWYYIVDRDYPPPYVFGVPFNVPNPHPPSVHTDILR